MVHDRLGYIPQLTKQCNFWDEEVANLAEPILPLHKMNLIPYRYGHCFLCSPMQLGTSFIRNDAPCFIPVNGTRSC